MTERDSSVTIYDLELLTPESLKPSKVPPGLSVSKVDPPSPTLNLEMYKSVGATWNWKDRLAWSDQQWIEYACNPAVETWLARLDDDEIGYFEYRNPDGAGDVQIVYFGLNPGFVGRGLGGAMLTVAVRTAWSFDGAKRVWLHTCTNDHPHALPNYVGRGFRVFRTRTVG